MSRPHPEFRRLRRYVLWIYVSAAVTNAAFAHAVLVSSSPQANAMIHGDSTEVILEFNSRIDAARSSLTLIVPDGRQQPLAPDLHTRPNVLESTAAHLGKGSYTLRWQVLASDGHITRGALSFAVR